MLLSNYIQTNIYPWPCVEPIENIDFDECYVYSPTPELKPLVGKIVSNNRYTYVIKNKDGVRNYFLKEIKEEIAKFISFAKSNPRISFVVSKMSISGYKDSDIAPLFKDCLTVSNIHLPISYFKQLVGVS